MADWIVFTEAIFIDGIEDPDLPHFIQEILERIFTLGTDEDGLIQVICLRDIYA